MVQTWDHVYVLAPYSKSPQDIQQESFSLRRTSQSEIWIQDWIDRYLGPRGGRSDPGLGTSVAVRGCTLCTESEIQNGRDIHELTRKEGPVLGDSISVNPLLRRGSSVIIIIISPFAGKSFEAIAFENTT